MYNFAIFDPRPIPAAQAANDAIFALGTVYGVEVTIPSLAARCITNIDPQHTGQDASKAAIEVAAECDLPTEGSVLVTVRPDLDSVGAMAILTIRAGDESIEPALGRIRLVAAADKFARGGWPGPRPLPSRDNPWDESSASAESSQPLAAIAAAVADFKVPIADRVAVMEKWLLTGEEPADYRAQVESERYTSSSGRGTPTASSRSAPSRRGSRTSGPPSPSWRSSSRVGEVPRPSAEALRALARSFRSSRWSRCSRSTSSNWV